jgi:hypothetical protein
LEEEDEAVAQRRAHHSCRSHARQSCGRSLGCGSTTYPVREGSVELLATASIALLKRLRNAHFCGIPHRPSPTARGARNEKGPDWAPSAQFRSSCI